MPMKLSRAAFKSLVDTLENVEQPLGKLCDKLWKSTTIQTHSNLSIGISIAALLQDELLPKPPQRLVAIYILYHMIVSRHTLSSASPSPSPSPSSTTGAQTVAVERLVDSPLTIILFELVDDGDKRLAEQLFLSHLLTHSHQQGQQDIPLPIQISQAPASTLWNALEGAMKSGAAVPKLNITSVKRLWNLRHPLSSCKLDNNVLPPVSGVVLDSDPYSTCEAGHLFDDLGCVVTLEDFVPAFVRIPPPLLPISLDNGPLSSPHHSNASSSTTPSSCNKDFELRWIDPEPLHEILWDCDMGIRHEIATELNEILSKACKSPIPEQLQMKIIQHLDNDPKLVHLCKPTPQKLPELIENNATLATKILLKLSSSKQMGTYLNALSNMEVNLHSMEVVYRLSGVVSLPSEFVNRYISNCIRSCGDIQDKYAQNKMVRFVCMFLKNLMKNKTVDVKHHYIEVQAFCIEYSRIREVADLFRSLKSYSAQQ